MHILWKGQTVKWCRAYMHVFCVHFMICIYNIIDHHSIVTVQEIAFHHYNLQQVADSEISLAQNNIPNSHQAEFLNHRQMQPTVNRVGLLVKENSWRTKSIQSFCKRLEDVPSHQDIKFSQCSKEGTLTSSSGGRVRALGFLQSLASSMVPHRVITALWIFTCNCPAPLEF